MVLKKMKPLWSKWKRAMKSESSSSSSSKTSETSSSSSEESKSISEEYSDIQEETGMIYGADNQEQILEEEQGQVIIGDTSKEMGCNYDTTHEH